MKILKIFSKVLGVTPKELPHNFFNKMASKAQNRLGKIKKKSRESNDLQFSEKLTLAQWSPPGIPNVLKPR